MPSTKKTADDPSVASTDAAPGSDQAGKLAKERDPSLDRTTQERIGAQLRTMYDSIKAEPVPDRFLQLLQQLESGGQKGSK